MPLISILIATRNRQIYAAALVNDIISWADDRTEIVVEDNSDSNSLTTLLHDAIASGAIRYHFNSAAISSIDNFNNAIENSSGQFVCLVGDDDGVNPAIVSVAAWAFDSDIDCVTGSVEQEYIWPADNSAIGGTPGRLSYPTYSGRHDFSDHEACRSGLLARGATRYLELPFPRLYHGLVRRTLLASLKAKNGYYLGGLSPDIYSAVALNALSKKRLSIDYPLTIPGVCPQSTTATEGKNATCSTNIRDAPHFRSRHWYEFSPRVPPVYCVDSIWADSAIAAMQDMNIAQDINDIDVSTLCAYIIRNNRSLLPTVFAWHQVNSAGGSFASTAWKLLSAYFNHPFKTDIARVKKKVRKILNYDTMLLAVGVQDIGEARRCLTLHLHNSQLDIVNILSKVAK